jgi:hypothetical protein
MGILIPAAALGETAGKARDLVPVREPQKTANAFAMRLLETNGLGSILVEKRESAFAFSPARVLAAFGGYVACPRNSTGQFSIVE